jgi:hypothetical protein
VKIRVIRGQKIFVVMFQFVKIRVICGQKIFVVMFRFVKIRVICGQKIFVVVFRFVVIRVIREQKIFVIVFRFVEIRVIRGQKNLVDFVSLWGKFFVEFCSINSFAVVDFRERNNAIALDNNKRKLPSVEKTGGVICL